VQIEGFYGQIRLVVTRIIYTLLTRFCVFYISSELVSLCANSLIIHITICRHIRTALR
jgi:hypothetical protein